MLESDELISTGDIAVEAFTCLLIFKNLFCFGLTYGAFDWLGVIGVADMFVIVGSIQVGICLLSIPMCKFVPQELCERG